MTPHDSSIGLGDVPPHGTIAEVLSDWVVRLPTDALVVARAAELTQSATQAPSPLRMACLHLLRVMKLDAQIEDTVAAECSVVLRLAVEIGDDQLSEVEEGIDPHFVALRKECALLEQVLAEELPVVRRYVDALLANDSAQPAGSEPSSGAESVVPTHVSPGGDSVAERNDQSELKLSEQIAAWAESYLPPRLATDEHTLVRVRAFLRTRATQLEEK